MEVRRGGVPFTPAAQVQLECGSWTRLSQDQKLQTIEHAIADPVSGFLGREYTSINRTWTGRCLKSHRYVYD
jgi:hypothetical protein